MARLDDWYIAYSKDFFTAPEQFPSMIVGKCYGHSKFKDGTRIVIGRVVSYENGVFTTIKGSRYILGVVNKDYEALFPNAFARLVNIIEKMGTKEL